jgi:hypothetical protein
MEFVSLAWDLVWQRYKKTGHIKQSHFNAIVCRIEIYAIYSNYKFIMKDCPSYKHFEVKKQYELLIGIQP